MSDSCGCGCGENDICESYEIDGMQFGKNPDSYKTGQLIEKFWELGFDVVFHGPIKEFPNGYITLESLLPEVTVMGLISDTVVVPYSELNDILEMILDVVTKSVEAQLDNLVLRGESE